MAGVATKGIEVSLTDKFGAFGQRWGERRSAGAEATPAVGADNDGLT
jgi:hypothetical protein